MPRVPALLMLACLAAAVPARADEVPPDMKGILAAHNQARAQVGVGKLEWSAELARIARGHADTLRGQGCRMRHSGAPGIGENLAWASGQRLSPAEAVRMWVNERRHYDSKRHTCAAGQQCGHYTQVVWAGTNRMGCGVARCGNSEVWVCNYAPPGNVVGQPPY